MPEEPDILSKSVAIVSSGLQNAFEEAALKIAPTKDKLTP
jgi:hypothetical protein